MTDIDHAAEAMGLRTLASAAITEANAANLLAAAQVHATLALVEQQRIANLIALAALPSINGFENEVYDASTEALMAGLLDSEEVAAVPGYGPAGVEQHVFIRADIKKGLGL